MTKQEKLQYCKGCKDNYYNGNNDRGVNECWSLDNAKVVKMKKVPIDQRPPWNQEPVKTLDCWRGKKTILVEPGKKY